MLIKKLIFVNSPCRFIGFTAKRSTRHQLLCGFLKKKFFFNFYFYCHGRSRRHNRYFIFNDKGKKQFSRNKYIYHATYLHSSLYRAQTNEFANENNSGIHDTCRIDGCHGTESGRSFVCGVNCKCPRSCCTRFVTLIRIIAAFSAPVVPGPLFVGRHNGRRLLNGRYKSPRAGFAYELFTRRSPTMVYIKVLVVVLCACFIQVIQT